MHRISEAQAKLKLSMLFCYLYITILLLQNSEIFESLKYPLYSNKNEHSIFIKIYLYTFENRNCSKSPIRADKNELFKKYQKCPL